MRQETTPLDWSYPLMLERWRALLPLVMCLQVFVPGLHVHLGLFVHLLLLGYPVGPAVIDVVDRWPSQWSDLARVPTAVLYDSKGNVGATPDLYNRKSRRRVADIMPRLQADFLWCRCHGRPDR